VHSGEILVATGSPVAGRSLAELLRQVPDVLLLGVRRGSTVLRWFEVEDALRVDDVLVAIGTEHNLARLQDAVEGRQPVEATD
jgi:uncharacterized protein with PhoU and TrkA domain